MSAVRRIPSIYLLNLKTPEACINPVQLSKDCRKLHHLHGAISVEIDPILTRKTSQGGHDCPTSPDRSYFFSVTRFPLKQTTLKKTARVVLFRISSTYREFTVNDCRGLSLRCTHSWEGLLVWFSRSVHINWESSSWERIEFWISNVKRVGPIYSGIRFWVLYLFLVLLFLFVWGFFGFCFGFFF